MTSATTVARYLEQRGLTGDTQLQKLVYYSQAWSLTWSGRPLFDEDVEAWIGGPVVQSVWAMQRHGDRSTEPGELSPSERAIVDAVYAFYGRSGGRKLSDMTHAERPWQEAIAQKTSKRHNPVISRSTIRSWYTEKALSEPAQVPIAPVLTGLADADSVREAGNGQVVRWRSLLDRLSKQ